jgi:hypothetical protein
MASTIVTSYDFESDTWTHNGDNPTRQAWREAVAEIAEKAKAKLPECSGRVDSAVKIVLAGDVELLADGTAKVASQSNGTTAYHIVNGECPCKDFAKAPHSFCKHRLSAAIARRAQELTKARPAQLDNASTSNGHLAANQPQGEATSALPLPEAPVSITLKATLHGHEVMVTLRGVDFASVKAQVEQASEWLKVQAPAQPPTRPPSHGRTQPTHDDSPYCHAHKAVLKRYERNGQVWYSHKTADGRWCRGQ